MLKTSLASILALTVLLAVVASFAPAQPALADATSMLHEEGVPARGGWLDGLLSLWYDLLGGGPSGGEALGVAAGSSCDPNDHCAADACYPEQCPTCSENPCVENACNPDACDGGSGDGGGQGGRFEPGG